MQFCFATTFSGTDELVPMATTAEACGWHALAVSDHSINPRHTRSTYPYTKDGSRRWKEGTHWPEPWVTIAFLAGHTTTLRFFSNIFVLPERPPVAVAKQVGTAAVLSGNRVALGIGMGWMEEEFEAMGQPFARRGKRADEMLEVMRKLWTGEFVEHHGEFFDLPEMEVLPVPSEPVPVWVGGTSEAALRRAARNDGWVSDLHTTEELRQIRATLDGYRKEYGRDDLPFAMVSACKDAVDLDGYRRLADLGVTHLMTWPWVFYAGFDATPQQKLDGIQRFADDIIAKL